MKNYIRLFCLVAIMSFSISAISAQRIELTINDAWRFTRDGAAVEVVNTPPIRGIGMTASMIRQATFEEWAYTRRFCE